MANKKVTFREDVKSPAIRKLKQKLTPLKIKKGRGKIQKHIQKTLQKMKGLKKTKYYNETSKKLNFVIFCQKLEITHFFGTHKQIFRDNIK